MIPAIGIAIYNRPDLLIKCLNSIDQEVGLLVIVNNGQLDLTEVSEVAKRKCDQVVFVLPEQNLGCAGGWNAILHVVFINRATPDYVLICGNDIEWMPGDLEVFATTVRDHPEVDFIAGNHSYSSFVMKRSCWEKVGAFDENIEIAYCEDNDHWQRMMRTPGVKAMHVAGLKTLHEGSQTIKSDADIARRSGIQHGLNMRYYVGKWGCTSGIGTERGQTPWNQPVPVNSWKLEGARLDRPHHFTGNPILDNPIIFTHCGKLGDFLYALPVAEWFYRQTGRKVHWVLPRGFGPFQYVANLACFQTHCAGVTLVDHEIKSFDCGGQPYRFNPADYGVPGIRGPGCGDYYNLGFRGSPDKYIPAFYAEEHGFDYVRDYRLSYATDYMPHYHPLPKTDDVLRTREDLMERIVTSPGSKPLPHAHDLLELVRDIAGAKEFHTWYCGMAVLAHMAGIPQHVYRVPAHASKKIYFPDPKNIEWHEVIL